MRAGKNPITGEFEIYLDEHERKELKGMIACAKLPERRTLYRKLMETL